MRVYLAAVEMYNLSGAKCVWRGPTDDIYLLSSFWRHNEFRRFGSYVYQEKHMLDSGAFTAINDKAGRYRTLDWDAYLTAYIAFVKQTKQRLFFELDIDCVVGYAKVRDYTKRIEDSVGRQPIPVWHEERHLEGFLEMCERYKYVAVGSIVRGKLAKNPRYLKWFIDRAHERGCQIHGLGFTDIRWLPKLPFDSVDSSSWLMVGKYGNVNRFAHDGAEHSLEIVGYEDRRLGHWNRPYSYSFAEWVKFQKWAERNLGPITATSKG